MLFKYKVRYIAVFIASLLLCGCLGGTVAQQIVRSIATSVADKAVASAMDVEDGPSNRKTENLQIGTRSNQNLAKPSQIKSVQTNSLPNPYTPPSTQPASEKALAKQKLENYNMAKRSVEQARYDPYRMALANTAFEEPKPQHLKPIAEPLPVVNVETENTLQVIQSSQLVRVELYNLLIEEEKNAVYEQARLMGASSLPQKREWALWRVATGAIQASQHQANQHQTSQKTITFLIPPEFGKLPSGAVTMVELAGAGELNVARYKAN